MINHELVRIYDDEEEKYITLFPQDSILSFDETQRKIVIDEKKLSVINFYIQAITKG